MPSERYAIALLVMITLCGCHNSGPPVKIVVPRDLHGEFQIVEAPEGAKVPFLDGEYVFTIPASGKLVVKSFGPFMQWHTESIVFDDGITARHFDHPAHSKSEEFAVFGGGITVGSNYPHPTQRYFVGLTSEASEWSESR